MDNLEPITRNEMFLNGDDLEPITREEMILAGADLEPITRHEWFLKKYRGGGGGGGYDLVNVPNLPANIASFNDGTDLPMASLKVTVTPYQDLSHGDPSPENICPIIGWDEAVVTVADDAESPTTSHEYTIDLGGTRYGGYLDVVSGVLTVDRVNLLLNGSEDHYTIQSSSADGNTVLRVMTRQACKQNENQKSNYGTFNNYAWQPLESRANTFVLGSEGNLYLQLTSSTASTVAEFKALFASNPLQVVYELATPITVQLAPTPVKSIEGVNKIYANCGQITEGKYFKRA